MPIGHWFSLASGLKAGLTRIIIILWFSIIFTIKDFRHKSSPAAWLLVPYLVWGHFRHLSQLWSIMRAKLILNQRYFSKLS